MAEILSIFLYFFFLPRTSMKKKYGIKRVNVEYRINIQSLLAITIRDPVCKLYHWNYLAMGIANLSAFRTFVRFALVWFCLFPLPLRVWEGLLLVIVALPGLFSYIVLLI